MSDLKDAAADLIFWAKEAKKRMDHNHATLGVTCFKCALAAAIDNFEREKKEPREGEAERSKALHHRV